MISTYLFEDAEGWYLMVRWWDGSMMQSDCLYFATPDEIPPSFKAV